MSDVLIVIPVRGGSVGIPRKALRLLGGKSPLQRTIETVQQVDADVVVTTDDRAVGNEAARLGVWVFWQSPALSSPDVPLDAPVHQATLEQEYRMGLTYQTVVTMQCTAPFTSVETVNRCIALVRELDTSVLTVRDDRGLRWDMAPDTLHLSTRAPRRVTRQKMWPQWRETGAVFATPRKWVEPTSRFAHTAYLVVVTGREAVDLDTHEDWVIAEHYAGVTAREQLLARVLADGPGHGGAVILSAWDEEHGEGADRVGMASNYENAHIMVGANTHEEAKAAIAECRGHDLTIVTSAYHAPRAFLTFLQVLKDQGRDGSVRLWSSSVPSSMDKLAGEWAKITEYQAKGHVASIEYGLAYLDRRDAHVAVAA